MNKESVIAPTSIDPSIFRAYDIRGIVDKQLSAETVCLLGKAIGTLAINKGEQRIAVGRDGRLSGPLLVRALCDGILSTGCDVIDLGVVPTPLLYYATFVLETQSGVMLTGSHNPADYNGLKMVISGETLTEGNIQALRHSVEQKTFVRGEGEYRELDVIERYIVHVVRNITLARQLKIVIDCGNGVAGAVAPELYRRMGCDVVELFCEIDGRFPNHHPDPSQTENLQDLIHAVKQHKADIGLAFDGDGDRIGVVTSAGSVIYSDRLLMLFAKAILQRKPDAKIIYDVKCTQHLGKMIADLGGIPIMWKTGHSFIKAKMIETKAALAGEMSGHIFFKDQWYGFDDALYAGARLLQLLAGFSGHSEELFMAIPNSVNTPELKIQVSEQEKFRLMEKIIADVRFDQAEISTIDGLRANFADGWGLIRLSNTTPCLVLRFEAEDEASLGRIQGLFRQQLLSVTPGLTLPF